MITGWFSFMRTNKVLMGRPSFLDSNIDASLFRQAPSYFRRHARHYIASINAFGSFVSSHERDDGRKFIYRRHENASNVFT